MTEVRATVFPDKEGYKGDNLYNGRIIKGKKYYYYGELSTNPEANKDNLDYSALGNLPYLYPIKITYGNKSVIGLKGDIGRGSVEYRPQIDLHKNLANQLGFSGRGIVKIVAVSL